MGSPSAGLALKGLCLPSPHLPPPPTGAQLTHGGANSPSSFQLTQALSGRFNSHVHVEYEWRLLHEDLDESDDDVDEKLQVGAGPQIVGEVLRGFVPSRVDPRVRLGHRVVLYKTSS